MRLVNDKKLTNLLENHYEAGCHGCCAFKGCNAKEKIKFIDVVPKSKRACFKRLREWLTPGGEK